MPSVAGWCGCWCWPRGGLKPCKKSTRKYSTSITPSAAVPHTPHTVPSARPCSPQPDLGRNPPHLLRQGPKARSSMRCFLLPGSLGLDLEGLDPSSRCQLRWTLLWESATAVRLAWHLDASSLTFLLAAHLSWLSLSALLPGPAAAPAPRRTLTQLRFHISHSSYIRSRKPRQRCFYTSQNRFKCLVK